MFTIIDYLKIEKCSINIFRSKCLVLQSNNSQGGGGGDSEEKGLQELLKGPLDKIKGEGGGGGRRWFLAGVGWRDGEKRHTTVIE